MKYFLLLVFIYALCLSPILYAQTEVLREPLRLTEGAVLFVDHNSGETGGNTCSYC